MRKRTVGLLMVLALACITLLPSLAGDIVVPRVEVQPKPVPDLPSFHFVQQLKVGWNLANTLDAFDADWLDDELAYETAWSGAMTTPGVFTALKEAGFKAVRIPVSWHNHVSGPDHVISQRWLDRVKQVVDDALDAGLFVILNSHHDDGKGFIYPDYEHLVSSKHFLVSLWRQLADAFQSYDDRLMMEGMNEPRLVGTDIEWLLDTDDPRFDEAVEVINHLNQAFVDTVRAGAGHNKTRYLLVPGYGASVQGVLHEGFEMPKDAPGVAHRLLLSVHAYIPYPFALQEPGEAGSRNAFNQQDNEDVEEIAWFMNALYQKFTPLQVPIVMDEFGSRDKGGNLQARVDFAAHYVAHARANGFPCFWWDNHLFEGEGQLFGLLDRETYQFVYPEIVEAIMTNAY